MNVVFREQDGKVLLMTLEQTGSGCSAGGVGA
jgi:hypothetical protein